MKKQCLKAAVLSAAISAGALLSGAAYADQLDNIIKESQSKLASAKSSQKRIDKLQDSTDDLLRDYKQVNKQIQDLEFYNAQLTKQLSNQRAIITDLDDAINNVVVIQRRIQPLIMRMLDGLDEFVKLDVPLDKESRLAAIAKVRANLDRADVDVAEKFRQVLELYDIEGEYGRKLDVKTAVLPIGGEELQVSILNVGRLALVYQTLDNKLTGVWDKEQNAWVELESGEYRSAVRKAMKIARKQATQDMIELPILAPEAAQ